MKILEKVISGGQNGADIAGVVAAKMFGISTGGCLPNGWVTLNGPRPNYESEFGMTQHSSSKYPPRTYTNARDADGTLRFASNFSSAGEICTLKAIQSYKKPYLDIDKNSLISTQQVADWLVENNIHILNIAGNSLKNDRNIGFFTLIFLSKVFTLLGYEPMEIEAREKFVLQFQGDVW